MAFNACFLRVLGPLEKAGSFIITRRWACGKNTGWVGVPCGWAAGQPGAKGVLYYTDWIGT